MAYLAAFVASFLLVAAKAFQQLNVVHDERWLIMPTSMWMAGCELLLWSYAASKGWDWILWLAIGLGAGFGCLISMHIHKRMRKRGLA